MPFSFALVLAAVAALMTIAGPAGAQPAAPAVARIGAPVRVATVIAVPQPWAPVISATGLVETQRRADISAALAGTLKEILVSPGQAVQAGQVLFRFDTSLEETELRVASAELPQLKTAYDRLRDLAARGLTAQSKLEEAQAAFDAAQARVNRIRSVIERRTVTAPFAGTAGEVAVSLGQYVEQGARLVRIDDASQVRVRARLPQRQLARLSPGQAATLTLAGLDSFKLPGKLAAIEGDGSGLIGAGEAVVTFDNHDGKLRAGTIVQVEFAMPEQGGVILLPIAAISYTPLGEAVYLVREARGADGKPGLEAVRVGVTLGDRQGDQVIVVKGVNAGDRIVVAGQLKLYAGAQIELADQEALPQRDQLRRN